MGKNANIIELNGKRYDALTGVMLSGAPHKTTNPRFVDGFSKGAAPTTAARSINLPVAPPHTAFKQPVMDISRPAPSKLAHHVPKKSQTLMRTAVHKPEPSIRRKAKATSHTHAVVQQPKFEIVKKLSHPKVDPKRAQRSARVTQSDYIRRFANPEAVRPITTAAIKPVYASMPAAHAVAAPAVAASSMDVFERALERANSHMELPVSHAQKRAKKRRSVFGKRALSISTATLAILLLTGFIAYQNQANLTVKYAATKAGFAANLPSYKPSGYSVGKFTYSPGQVGVIYANSASGQSFSLLQKQSSWNSTVLRDSFVATHSASYKTIQSAGRTIYTYGNNNATWVNGGVWYQVNTAGSLTTAEIVNLATSM